MAEDLSLTDHLEELRMRVIIISATMFVCAGFVYVFVDPLLQFITQPVKFLIFTSPADAFLVRIQLALWGGFFLSLPVVFYQAWRFVAVGLMPSEKKRILVFGPLSVVLFLVGIVFAYQGMVPIVFHFLLGFASPVLVPMISVDKYISFVAGLMLGCGVVFELPLVVIFLTRVGIVSPEGLKQKRRHVFLGILIFSAFLTPPDVVTQMFMTVPLVLLYEVGIILSQVGRKNPAG